MTTTFDDDLICRKTFVANSITLPPSCVTSATVLAGTNIDADKTEQRFFPGYSQPNSAATTETRTLFVARRTGVVNQFIAGSIAVATGNAIVTLDLRKNNVTVLVAVITLDNANVIRITESGAFSGVLNAFVIGDWFEVIITATIGTGVLPTGVFCQLEVDQNGV